jgi:hypothetical protein
VLLALPYKPDPDLVTLQIGDRKDRVSYQVNPNQIQNETVAVVTVVTGSDDDGSNDTRGTQKMTGVNCIEFALD